MGWSDRAALAKSSGLASEEVVDFNTKSITHPLDTLLSHPPPEPLLLHLPPELLLPHPPPTQVGQRWYRVWWRCGAWMHSTGF